MNQQSSPSGGNPIQSPGAHHQIQTNVQPAFSGPLAQPMPDYLCFSILNIIAVIPLLGIVAIFFSLETRECNKSGDRLQAVSNSRKARFLNFAALGVGCIFLIMYTVICAVFGKKS